ncbi:excalibur calcium-binding domain-containing protein [uncultured Jannaschia sp.]|uniref:excalibur calcium-binding domain-containing protein n=1 Tax=uncultured Jannaschia sp. TaxID=293347 RepID=UPI002638564E|nr:excalibur calcium-binding domain-containing protein [uncultured Jannaschia sp.]
MNFARMAVATIFAAIPLGGTVAQSCHSSYELVCVPAGVSDVDCAGGSGNGPYYVRGPVRVVGWDEYRLDRDGDGIACER